ncbi:uncharacterized protein [Coffea arabica]|uniref:Uncharacterized protein n=1 Tax=Coffea arabica TaxID=13443 RepID=A0A6P6S4A1_COFAR|nr:optic atrophy 3 protein homolog [Coffea arabica]
MIIPVIKLGTLALRTISKPIANRLKKDAGLHPKFRDFIINIAQANHRFSTIMQRRIYGYSSDLLIRPLNEERAVQAAADILGELFVFSVAGLAIVYEVQRSSRAEARKEEKRKQEMEAIQQKNQELAKEVETLKNKVEAVGNLQRKLEEVELAAKRCSSWNLFKLWNAQTPAYRSESRLKQATQESSCTDLDTIGYN